MVGKAYVAVAAAAGCVALYAVYKVSQKGVAGAAADMVGGVLSGVGGVAVGTVHGIGDSMGLPRTDVAAGEAAWNAGQYGKASTLLPATNFIGKVFSGYGSTLSDSIWANESTF